MRARCRKYLRIPVEVQSGDPSHISFFLLRRSSDRGAFARDPRPGDITTVFSPTCSRVNLGQRQIGAETMRCIHPTRPPSPIKCIFARTRASLKLLTTFELAKFEGFLRLLFSGVSCAYVRTSYVRGAFISAGGQSRAYVGSRF